MAHGPAHRTAMAHRGRGAAMFCPVRGSTTRSAFLLVLTTSPADRLASRMKPIAAEAIGDSPNRPRYRDRGQRARR